MTEPINMRQSFALDEAMAFLARTPATLDALLRDLPARWSEANEGGDTWSAFDVVGHLIHGERTDWLPRARIILEHGEARPFEKFDRFAQYQGSKENRWPACSRRSPVLRQDGLRDLAAWT